MIKTNSRSFYVRVTDFDFDDELCRLGPPRLVGKPVSDPDHVKAYQNLLFPTKEAAIQSFFDEIGQVRLLDLDHRPSDGIVCKAEIEADGRIWCFKRVAKLESERVQMIDLDENFGLSISREEIFEMAEVEDRYKPSHPRF